MMKIQSLLELVAFMCTVQCVCRTQYARQYQKIPREHQINYVKPTRKKNSQRAGKLHIALHSVCLYAMIVNGNKFNIWPGTQTQTHTFRNNLYFVTQLTKQISRVYCGTNYNKINTKPTRAIYAAYFFACRKKRQKKAHILREKSQNNCN